MASWSWDTMANDVYGWQAVSDPGVFWNPTEQPHVLWLSPAGMQIWLHPPWLVRQGCDKGCGRFL